MTGLVLVRLAFIQAGHGRRPGGRAARAGRTRRPAAGHVRPGRSPATTRRPAAGSGRPANSSSASAARPRICVCRSWSDLYSSERTTLHAARERS